MPCVVFVKERNVKTDSDCETWKQGVARTLNVFENSTDSRATAVIVQKREEEIGTVACQPTPKFSVGGYHSH